MTPEKERKIIDTYRKEQSLRIIVKLYHVSVQTASAVLKRHGVPIREPCHGDEEVDRKVAELYPTQTMSEIAEGLGITQSRVARIRKRLNLEHTPETVERIKGKWIKNVKVALDPEVKARRDASRNKTIRREMRRLLGGEKRQTKLQMSLVPKKTRKTISRLCCKYGYIYGQDSTWFVYYDNETRRRINTCHGDEEYYTKRHGIIFKPLK